MKIPLIGISCGRNYNDEKNYLIHSLSSAYVDAVTRAGGTAVAIPSGLSGAALDALYARLDGVLFSGGGDVDPALFDGAAHERVYGIDEGRDALEIDLARRAAADGKPFMGICRGVQILNVALGGSLYTDIHDQFPGALRHDWYPDIPRDTIAHVVTLAADSRLAGWMGGERQETNSLHHQGLQRPAASLRVVGYAPDGMIEAVELSGHPFGIGVQWHPECLPERPEHQAIFRAFVAAASQ